MELKLKATINNETDLQGKFWSSGIHHVFVDDEPATIYVPENTILPTFNNSQDKINNEGRIPLGIDHLSDEILKDNQILAKMNLLDVGEVTQIGTDGKGLYVMNSEIKNEQIRELNQKGELPSYSIIANFNGKKCPSGKVDYIIESVDIERIDIVEKGGCTSCNVGENPSDLKLYAKSSDNMDKEKQEEINTKIKELKELGVDITLEEEQEEPSEQEEEEEEQKEEETEEKPPEDSEPSVKELLERLDNQEQEIAELKKLGGKKPSENKADEEVDKLIKAGFATPKMKEGLIATYNADTEAFKTLKASLPKVADFSIKAKFGVKSEKEKKEEKEQAKNNEIKDIAENVFGVTL
nr:hypothetical protein [Methanobrevibacter arboriphilus]